MIDVLTDGLRSDGGGLDASVTDDFGGKGAEEGLALISGLSEFGELLSVAHHRQF